MDNVVDVGRRCLYMTMNLITIYLYISNYILSRHCVLHYSHTHLIYNIDICCTFNTVMFGGRDARRTRNMYSDFCILFFSRLVRRHNNINIIIICIILHSSPWDTPKRIQFQCATVWNNKFCCPVFSIRNRYHRGISCIIIIQNKQYYAVVYS